MNLILTLITLCLLQGALGRYVGKEFFSNGCGYESCHPTKEDHVNVHLIPHSHDDVGWVKTVDQFFYGTRSSIYHAGVTFIYDSVLNSVRKNEERRFIFVESAFFWRWWQEQGDYERNALVDLVSKGQIEYAGGGWSMNDEAVTNYQSIIDQMTWGLKKLNDTFGECGRPKVGWQIDPFGHSSEMASTFAQLGFDGVILGRIDYEDKLNRLKSNSMEMLWQGSRNLGETSQIFTSVLHNHYDAPAGFCFDVLCEDDSLVDDPDSPEYNIEAKAEEFITKHVQPAVASYQSSNIIIPMGRDFAYQEAESWFRNIDRLIKYVNAKTVFNDTKYHLMYSTASCYVNSVNQELNGVLSSSLKEDDFFPYATDPHSYWTGYYTSRPTLKRYERMGNNFLQICKQLYALALIPFDQQYKLDKMRDAMGIMQHHDAITGTEREVVAYDYARLLDVGFKNCEDLTFQALSSLTDSKPDSFETCLLVNVSQCVLTEEADVFVVTVYNPLSRLVSKYVRVPVYGTAYLVTDPNGQTIKSELVPIAEGVKNIIGRSSEAPWELVFEGQNIPPLGFKSFHVKKQPGDQVLTEYLSLDFSYTNNQGVGFSLDPSTGLINQIEMNDISLVFDQRFWFYNGSNGWMDDLSSKASGAYIFRPDQFYPLGKVSDTARFEVYRGQLLTEVHQHFNDFVSQVVRIYNNEEWIEFDWVVGPLNTGGDWFSDHGKEVISRFSTNLRSDSVFYTDSNGREMLKRVRNFRPSWDITVNETESANYYPVTSRIVIKDEEENLEMAVLTDRAQGGSSLSDGEVELMLLRNSITDDQLGVGEALIEIAFNRPIMARGSHFLTVGRMNKVSDSESTSAAIQHDIATRKLLDSWIFLSVPEETTFEDYKAAHSMQFSGLNDYLPQQVHILTLEPWTENSYLLRLEHSFEDGLDPLLSQPVEVNLEGLFTTFDIKNLQETTLGGNQWLQDSQRLQFKTESSMSKKIKNQDSDLNVVTLNPMQVRTFIITVEPRM